MNSKRLLLLIDDPFLSRFHREKMEAAGFQVDLARDLAHGLDLLQADRPDVLVLDSVLPGSDAVQSLDSIRAAGVGSELPIIVLPTPHYSVSQRLESDPQVRLLKPSSNPLGELFQRVSELLQGQKKDEGALMLATLPDESWRMGAVDAAQQSVCEMRHLLHDLSRPGADAQLLGGILQQVHRLSAQAGLLSRNALTNITIALEVMVYNLTLYPERFDALSLRTLTQAVDFLSLLLHDGTYSRMPEFDSAHIMIIEDEASARELIIAAMELVGLQANGLESPNGGLSALGSKAYDLIFLDINLPEMNGFDLCNKVRSLPLHERTPIVFLTGMASFQNRVQSSLSGGNDFIGKPFNVAELGVKALMWVMKGKLGLN
jgi:DNA-binding response OmpR family regulator